MTGPLGAVTVVACLIESAPLVCLPLRPAEQHLTVLLVHREHRLVRLALCLAEHLGVLLVHGDALVNEARHSRAELQALRANLRKGAVSLGTLLALVSTLLALFAAVFLNGVGTKRLFVTLVTNAPAELAALAVQLLRASTVKQAGLLQLAIGEGAACNNHGCHKANVKKFGSHRRLFEKGLGVMFW